MTYPYVQSAVDLGRRKGPVLGFVIHHAEGGGTVGYLAKPNPNGVSVHYVLEYSGRVVQMLREDHMHTSIRTSAIRTTNDGDGFYGAAAAKAVLGDWARTQNTLGPNHATLAVEIEGFAAKGPNTAQKAALALLVADIRSRYPRIGLLGHRDFADYKQCPGKLIPWQALGGHGPAAQPEPTPEDDMLKFKLVARTPGRFTATVAGSAFNVGTKQPRAFAVGYVRNAVARVALAERLSPSLDIGEPMLLTTNGDDWEVIAEQDGRFELDKPPDCGPAVTAGVNAALDKVRDGFPALLQAARS